MKKIYPFIVITFGIYLFSSCQENLELLIPEFTDGSILSDAEELEPDLQSNMAAVYKVVSGSDFFGSHIVVLNIEEKVCFYAAKSGIYFIGDTGIKDSVILCEGKWRNPRNISIGLLRLFSDGLEENDSTYNFTGFLGTDNSPLTQEFRFVFERRFSDNIKNRNYFILAHRGGGRNSDYVGVSENSLEMIELAEYFGSNGIEIDVKMSKDNIPFLYHDKEVNRRLLQPTTVVGPIEELSFPQIKSFLVLKNGEQIPSLEEALDHVIYETNLKIVWLDMKSDKASAAIVRKIQEEKQDAANTLGRDLQILMGVPTQDIYEDVINQNDFQSIKTLCELEVEKVRNLDSRVWAPRWTLGPQTDLVRQMHSEGRLVFTWTLDDEATIESYVNDTEFDGILSNYPTIVTYNYYVQK